MLSHLLALFPSSEPSSFNCHHSVFLVYIFAKENWHYDQPKEGYSKKEGGSKFIWCGLQCVGEWERLKEGERESPTMTSADRFSLSVWSWLHTPDLCFFPVVTSQLKIQASVCFSTRMGVNMQEAPWGHQETRLCHDFPRCFMCRTQTRKHTWVNRSEREDEATQSLTVEVYLHHSVFPLGGISCSAVSILCRVLVFVSQTGSATVLTDNA